MIGPQAALLIEAGNAATAALLISFREWQRGGDRPASAPPLLIQVVVDRAPGKALLERPVRPLLLIQVMTIGPEG